MTIITWPAYARHGHRRRIPQKETLKSRCDGCRRKFAEADFGVGLFGSEMGGIAGEPEQGLEGPDGAVEVDGAVVGNVELEEGNSQTAPVGFDKAFLGSPEAIKRGEGVRRATNGLPFPGCKLGLEIFKGEGFDLFDIDADPASLAQGADHPVTRMRNVKIGTFGEVRFGVRGVEQIVEGGWGTGLVQPDEQQQFAEKGRVSVLPASVAEDLWLQGGRQPV